MILLAGLQRGGPVTYYIQSVSRICKFSLGTQLKKEGEITKGGIILRNHSNDKALLAKVIAVGPGAMSQGIRIIMEVKDN